MSEIPLSDYNSSYSIDKVDKEKGRKILYVNNEYNKASVIKILYEYEDDYRCWVDLSQRQQCLLKALQKGLAFSPLAYRGIAPVLSLGDNDGRLCLGPISSSYEEACTYLDSEEGKKTEYAVIMKKMPANRRLDILLADQYDVKLTGLLKCVVRRVWMIHNAANTVKISDEQKRPFGRKDQIEKKVEHNICAFEKALEKGMKLTDISSLFNNVKRVLECSELDFAFQWRLRMKCIKECHGDLHSENIWVLDEKDVISDDPSQRVVLLDAIDFNDLYCCMDVLSDLAMLIIDVQARSNRPGLGDIMIDEYMRMEHAYGRKRFNERITRCILRFYLVEKAMVRAAISLDGDDLKVGRRFLNLLNAHIEKLKSERELMSSDWARIYQQYNELVGSTR